MLSRFLLRTKVPSRAWQRAAPLSTTSTTVVSTESTSKDEIHHLLDDHFGYGVAKPYKVTEFREEEYVKILPDDAPEPPTEKLQALQELVRQTEQRPKSALRKSADYSKLTRLARRESTSSGYQEGLTKKNLVDPTKIHEYKRAHDESEFGV